MNKENCMKKKSFILLILFANLYQQSGWGETKLQQCLLEHAFIQTLRYNDHTCQSSITDMNEKEPTDDLHHILKIVTDPQIRPSSGSKSYSQIT